MYENASFLQNFNGRITHLAVKLFKRISLPEWIILKTFDFNFYFA